LSSSDSTECLIYNRPKIVTSLEIVREESSDKASNVPEGTVENSKYLNSWLITSYKQP